MSDKKLKEIDVKLHNFMVRQREINNALSNWVIHTEKLVVIPKLRELDTRVCMSAIL